MSNFKGGRHNLFQPIYWSVTAILDNSIPLAIIYHKQKFMGFLSFPIYIGMALHLAAFSGQTQERFDRPGPWRKLTGWELGVLFQKMFDLKSSEIAENAYKKDVSRYSLQCLRTIAPEIYWRGLL